MVGEVLGTDSMSRADSVLLAEFADTRAEDAFAALGSRGYSVLVRTEVRESFARFWLRPPEELVEFLDLWIASSQSHSRAATAEASR